jgi:hypothetical protein
VYRSPDPELADAYRVTARQVQAQQRVDSYVDSRFTELQRILGSRSRYHVEVDAGPWAPAGSGRIYITTDIAHWIAEKRDPHGALVSLLLGRECELLDAYALDRASAEAESKAPDYWTEVA